MTSTPRPPVAPPVSPAVPERPGLGAILRRLTLNLLVACGVPAMLFYVALVTVGMTYAVVVALGWSYGAIAWRRLTGRPTSGLLLLISSILTVRSAFALWSGDTFVYFLQPVVGDAVVAVLFLLSLATARPLVARLAADFYPMCPALADHPRVRRLFWRLTLMWGAVCLLKGAIGYWLLETLSVATFVLVKNGSMIGITVVAVAVTVWASMLVVRHEDVLNPA